MSTIVIEAGCGAHHWARAYGRLGHESRLIHDKFVRPFVKTNKNDWNDATAIGEAAQRPTMRFVAAKSLEQQDLLAVHRIRERLVAQQTAVCNQIRGLLAEYGIRCVAMFTKRVSSYCPDGADTASAAPTIQSCL